MILVTGGTGFVGAYIIKHLVEKKYAVRALRRTGSKLPFFIPSTISDQVQWVNGDVLDMASLDEAMEGAAGVIHAAAKVSFNPAEKDDMMQANIEGTANVVNTAIDRNISRFIHISSVAALGRSATGETVNEERKWQDTKVNTNYAVSKYKAEMEVWRGMGEGLQAAIINPSTIVGYGDWNTSSCAIFKNVYNEFPYYTGGVNGFVYVEDVAAATVQLFESSIIRERFIASSENWPFRRLFDTIAGGFAKKRPHIRATPLLGAVAWRAEKLRSVITGRQSLLSKESARVAQSKTYFDNAKIIKALPGFSFTPLEQAIAKSCRQYLEQEGRGGEW